MCLALVVAHGKIFARQLTEIDAEWVLEDAGSAAREVLVRRERWNVHQPERVLFPFRAVGEHFRGGTELEVCHGRRQVHHGLLWLLALAEKALFDLVRVSRRHAKGLLVALPERVYVDCAHLATRREPPSIRRHINASRAETAFIS